MGVGGITLATAIVSLVTSVLLAIALRAQIGGVDMARTVHAGTRILGAGALCAAVALGMREALGGLGDSLLEQTALVAVASGTGLAVYGAVVMALRVEEARQITALVRGQLARFR
jgi:hypothetical protein